MEQVEKLESVPMLQLQNSQCKMVQSEENSLFFQVTQHGLSMVLVMVELLFIMIMEHIKNS